MPDHFPAWSLDTLEKVLAHYDNGGAIWPAGTADPDLHARKMRESVREKRRVADMIRRMMQSGH